jgi:retinol dehydrogenase-12
MILSVDSKKMQGMICLVTGATAGIGKVTATALAAQGAEVVITGRNPQKLETVTREIIAGTGNQAIQSLCADFSDLEQVRALAVAFKKRHSYLNVLINNAGAYFHTRWETPYGVEMTFLVNHLAPFFLTNLLLETIRSSGSARIVNVSSDAHKYDWMNFEDLGFKHGYFGMKAYARSKLANILFTYALAERMPASEVTVNALHPGHVATDIWKSSFPVIGPALKQVMSIFSLSPEQGADNSIYLASSPEMEGITGKYYVKREASPSSPISYEICVVQKLWEISERLTGFSQ